MTSEEVDLDYDPDEPHLTEAEVLRFCHAWENDSVRDMEPLVEKYGWEELFERFHNSVDKPDD
jgi:hypothetical protein